MISPTTNVEFPGDGWRRAQPWLDALAIAALAAAIRLSGLDAVPWDQTQVEILKLVDPIVDQDRWPAVGWEISGRFGGVLPALLFWLLAIPRFVTRSPMALIGFGAAFDVVAAALTYAIARILFGRAAGLMAGILYALDAALVTHSQILWNLTMVPCFTALMLLGLVLLVVERRPLGAALVVVALAVNLQLHFLTAYLIPPVLVLLVVYRPRLRGGYLGRAFALTVLLWAPYLGHEVRHGFPNLRAAAGIAASVFTGSVTPEVDAAPARFNQAVLVRGATFRNVELPNLPTRFLPKSVEPATWIRAFDEVEAARGALSGLGAALLAVSLCRGVAERRRTGSAPRSSRVAALLLSCYALPLGVLALARFRIYDRYLLPLHPLPIVLAVAWVPLLLPRPGSRRDSAPRSRLARWSRAIGAVALVVALTAPHLSVLRELRRDARTTGLIANDGTLGSKIAVARFFLEDLGLDAPAFERDTSFFSWPGGPAPDRHTGFRPLFAYLVDGLQVPRRLDRPRGPRYLVVYRGEEHHVIPDLITNETFERETFSVVRLDPALELGYASRGSSAPDDWWHTGGHTDGWIMANFPLSWGGDSALSDDVTAQYMELPFELHAERPHGLFVLQTRECVAWVSLNGEMLARDDCPPGRAADERESVIHAYPLDGHWAVGKNVLRFELVLRYPSSILDAYVVSLKGAGRLLAPPPEVARFAPFVSPDPRRFRVRADQPPAGWVPVGLPVPDEAKLASWLRAGPDTSAVPTFGPRLWSMPTWQVDYGFESQAGYFQADISPYPRPDFRRYWGLAMALEAHGTGGAYRLVVRDRDGGEWRYQDDTVMWEDGLVALAVPFAALRRDESAGGGSGALDLAHVQSVMVQVLPGRAHPPLRDQTFRFTPPILLDHRPARPG